MDISWSNIIASVTTLIAAFLGALCANWLNTKKEERNEVNFEQSLIRSLESELKTLRELYADDLINNLEKLNDNEIYLWKYSARQDFFTIYHSNCLYIGKIKDEILKTKIIKTYTNAKSFLENLLDYTENFNKFDLEKEIMLKKLNMVFKNPVCMYQLEEILNQALSVKAALVNLNFTCENENVILDLEKNKENILRIKNNLKYYTKNLKKHFSSLKEDMSSCFHMIDNYLMKTNVKAKP